MKEVMSTVGILSAGWLNEMIHGIHVPGWSGQEGRFKRSVAPDTDAVRREALKREQTPGYEVDAVRLRTTISVFVNGIEVSKICLRLHGGLGP